MLFGTKNSYSLKILPGRKILVSLHEQFGLEGESRCHSAIRVPSSFIQSKSGDRKRCVYGYRAFDSSERLGKLAQREECLARYQKVAGSHLPFAIPSIFRHRCIERPLTILKDAV